MPASQETSQSRRDTRQEAPRVKYYFVRADKVRDSTATTLPALQTLLADATTRDWIVEKEMTFEDACRGEYVGGIPGLQSQVAY